MRYFMTAALAAMVMAGAMPAHAVLGDKAASVAADGTRFRARVASQARGGYTDNVITIDDGLTVHEYTALDGTVFAVSWEGVKRPDLKQLFGPAYFPRFQADNASSPGHIHMRRALASTHSDFVVRTGGYSGAQWGYAYLPGATPLTFSLQTLQQ